MAATVNGATPTAQQKQDLAIAFDLARVAKDPTTGSVVGLVGPSGGDALQSITLSSGELRQGIPSGGAPSGSVGANGALTLGTPLGYVYGPGGVSDGVYLWFPAGAIYSGSLAGSYWCVMSSTTVGTVYDNRLDAVPGAITKPLSPTPVISASVGAFTGNLGSFRTVAGVTVPAGKLGKNGQIRVTVQSSQTTPASAGTKNLQITFGGQAVGSYALTTFVVSEYVAIIRNRGSELMQISPRGNMLVPGSQTSGSHVSSNVDTTQAQPLLIQIQCTTAADFAVIESIDIEILPYP